MSTSCKQTHSLAQALDHPLSEPFVGFAGAVVKEMLGAPEKCRELAKAGLTIANKKRACPVYSLDGYPACLLTP